MRYKIEFYVEGHWCSWSDDGQPGTEIEVPDALIGREMIEETILEEVAVKERFCEIIHPLLGRILIVPHAWPARNRIVG